MNHRHLLPDEIDLLIDDEVGFGVAPLKTHLRDCADCRAQVEAARAALNVLEDVPHFAPSHSFADRVMTQVPVFVPWHVTAMDTVNHWLPQSRTARVAVGALATSAASVLTVGILWLGSQSDVVALASGVATDQARGLAFTLSRELLSGAFTLSRELLSGAFGDQMFATIQQTGTLGIGAALLGLAAAAAGTVAGLGALATASSRRRS